MANKYVKSFNFGGDTLYPLPIVDASHEGMVLKVVNNAWIVADLISQSPAPSLINFTISDEGTIYNCQAEVGMTWAEWINSNYYKDNPNILPILTYGSTVYAYNGGYPILGELDLEVQEDDTIRADFEYIVGGSTQQE